MLAFMPLIETIFHAGMENQRGKLILSMALNNPPGYNVLEEALQHDFVYLENVDMVAPEKNILSPSPENLTGRDVEMSSFPVDNNNFQEYSFDNNGVSPIPDLSLFETANDEIESEVPASLSVDSPKEHNTASTSEYSSESSSSSDTSEAEDTENSHRTGKPLGRKKKRKILQDSGQEYVNTSGRIVPGKTLKQSPCGNGAYCVNECRSFTDEERAELFREFWGLKDSSKQKVYLSECTRVGRVKRRRKSKNKKQRRFTNEYCLQKNQKPVKVCRKFLLDTLGVTVRQLRTVLQNKANLKFTEPDSRGKHQGPGKLSDEQFDHLNKFVTALPAVPSHYCRSSSSKKYLPSDVKSINNVYKMYIQKCREENFQPILKRSKFLAIFKTYNIGIHVPKKDKCAKCERYTNLPADMKSESEMQKQSIHLEEKEAAKKKFLAEQDVARGDPTLLVASFDLQKVLSTPHGDSMAIGFSRKYAVYNFTV